MTVTVYTQPDCRACKRVIQKLDEGGVELEVIDISRDRVAKDYLTRVLLLKSVPVIETDEQVIAGYQPDKIKELIDVYGN